MEKKKIIRIILIIISLTVCGASLLFAFLLVLGLVLQGRIYFYEYNIFIALFELILVISSIIAYLFLFKLLYNKLDVIIED